MDPTCSTQKHTEIYSPRTFFLDWGCNSYLNMPPISLGAKSSAWTVGSGGTTLPDRRYDIGTKSGDILSHQPIAIVTINRHPTNHLGSAYSADKDER